MTAFLKAEKLLVVLASDPNLFQSFAPLNEKLFCPKDVFNSGRFKSSLESQVSVIRRGYLSENRAADPRPSASHVLNKSLHAGYQSLD